MPWNVKNIFIAKYCKKIKSITFYCANIFYIPVYVRKNLNHKEERQKKKTLSQHPSHPNCTLLPQKWPWLRVCFIPPDVCAIVSSSSLIQMWCGAVVTAQYDQCHHIAHSTLQLISYSTVVSWKHVEIQTHGFASSYFSYDIHHMDFLHFL